MGGCSWSITLQKSRLASGPRGTLFRLQLISGTSEHPDDNYDKRSPIQWDKGTYTVYVFCSKRFPLVVGPTDGPREESALDLYHVFGATESAIRMYMRECHGLDILPEAARLNSLGYQRSLMLLNRSIKLRSVGDVFVVDVD